MNYNIIYISYENVFHDVSNNIDFVLYMLTTYSKIMIKLYIV
jgi:hypothetical protein